MTSALWPGFGLSMVALVLTTACAPKRISLPVRSGQSLTVLLPDSATNTAGDARVSNPFGGVELADERDAALATPNQAPVFGKLTQQEVQNIFGDALSALPPPPQRFTLFFRFESDALTDQSQALIPQILAAVRKHAVQDVVVIGHTDTMGTQPANYTLGLKRALMVRNLLVDAGLDGSTIEATSVGELDPLVKTADETPEPRNRRVDIAVRSAHRLGELPQRRADPPASRLSLRRRRGDHHCGVRDFSSRIVYTPQQRRLRHPGAIHCDKAPKRPRRHHRRR